ncbi:MAG: hypothetical protein ABIC04_07425 [Nanoarchaeota archaeon]
MKYFNIDNRFMGWIMPLDALNECIAALRMDGLEVDLCGLISYQKGEQRHRRNVGYYRINPNPTIFYTNDTLPEDKRRLTGVINTFKKNVQE